MEFNMYSPPPHIAFMTSGGCSCTPAYSTGDRSGSITVTSNVTYGGAGPMSNWVDGGTGQNDTDSLWWTGGQTSSSLYIRFDFGSGNSVKITEAKFYQSVAVSHGTWKWQGSDDASAWTDIGSSFTLGNGVLTQTQTELSGNTVGYRYYQLIGVSPNTTQTPWLHEFEFEQCTC